MIGGEISDGETVKFPSDSASVLLWVTGAMLGYYFAKEDIRQDIENKYKISRRIENTYPNRLFFFLLAVSAALPLCMKIGVIYGANPLTPRDFVAFLMLAIFVVIGYFGTKKDIRNKFKKDYTLTSYERKK